MDRGGDILGRVLEGSYWNRLRGLSTGVALAMVVVIGGAVQGILGLVTTPTWLRVVAALGVAGLGVLALVDKHRTEQAREQATETSRAKKDAADRARWERQVAASIRWPLVPLSEMDPVGELGVRRSQLAAEYSGNNGLAPYIRRSAHAAGVEQLRRSGMLLIIGDAASGMTRTAYEIARDDVVDRLTLTPHIPSGLRSAVDELEALSHVPTSTPLLTWLDRIDRFSEENLSADLLRRIRAHSPGGRIVATISRRAFPVWSVERQDISDRFDHCSLQRLPTPSELEAARDAYPDLNFKYGLAATFTAAGALAGRLDSGFMDCPHERPSADCQLARRLVELTTEWTSTGTRRRLSLARLTDLIQGEAFPDASDQHIESALAWATEPVVEGPSLLVAAPEEKNPTAVSLLPHEELTGLVATNISIRDDVWQAAVHDASEGGDLDSVGRIGFTAHTKNCFRAADVAWSCLPNSTGPGTKWLDRAYAYSLTGHDQRGRARAASMALQLQELEFGHDHVVLVSTLTNLGDALRHLGEYRESYELFERALPIAERELGPDHVDVASVESGLGNALLELGEYREAFRRLERSAAILESEYGSDHVEMAPALNNLGNARLNLGDYQGARDLYERTLQIEEKAYGPDHREVASTLNNLGNVLQELGEYRTASKLYERALVIRRREFGRDHVLVAALLNNLGTAFFRMGEYTKALDLAKQALSIREREYGDDHVLVASTMVNVGNALYGLREYKKSLEMHERALAIEEREYGRDHVEVAATLNNIGNACVGLKDYRRGCQVYERALAIREHEYGQDHVLIVDLLLNLAGTYHALENSRRTRETLLRAVDILRRCQPPDKPRRKRATELLRRHEPDLVILDDGRVVQRGAKSAEPGTHDASADDEPT